MFLRLQSACRCNLTDLYRRGPRNNAEGDDSDSDEEEEEEEESEEESEDEPAASASAPAAPELSRTERRDLKKKQAAEKQAAEEEDPDLINTNHIEKKLNISDLGAPRELSRRER